ncbi:CCR4-NOT transcription complex subunit 1-like isoform X2 [Solanum tuberosum]|uniref:CCR4-NOT transcription complex subunit 1-like isoform X2 n=1 Tax=Solanum tuberosum TaxID=4113 RepID=UPI00073A3FDB|nr:PREDICTED: CCR4-NOT transcription complex subunit 1-like isoform X2 [Solanum tuberosum]
MYVQVIQSLLHLLSVDFQEFHRHMEVRVLLLMVIMLMILKQKQPCTSSKLFSGQLTSDAVIQILAQFKGSTDNRQQAIFQCMIVKLCREYKIYAMYPEKQLKIAAAFLESLTKNKLITHPTVWKICNQALRAVLDELHEVGCC